MNPHPGRMGPNGIMRTIPGRHFTVSSEITDPNLCDLGECHGKLHHS